MVTKIFSLAEIKSYFRDGSFKPHVYSSIISDLSPLPGSFSISDERVIPDSDLKRYLS